MLTIAAMGLAVIASPPARAQGATEPPKVSVIQPKAEAVTDYVELTGNAAAISSVNLVARVEGYLETQNFQDGAVVKKDDLLFKIQQDQYKAQLIEAQAQVQAAKAGIEYARTEIARYKGLVKQEAAAQTEVDHWVYEKASAEAKLLGAQAQVTLAQLNLGYTEIRAPYDGQMSKAQIYPGNLVGSPGAQSTALATIYQIDPIYVVANLSEQDGLRIRQNLEQKRLTAADLPTVPIQVALQNETDFPRRGALEYVSPAIDPATGTILLRGKLANPNRDLLPGFFVRIRLPMERGGKNTLLVPDRALQEDQGGRYLLAVNKDGVVEKRYVQLGELFSGLRAITSGIAAGDRIIVGDLWRVSPGQKVTPQLTSIDALGNRP
ncbi:MAG TPA: efflux RND transporter periplasmic adaptor subunit [Stellaceae bacterium]|nr:efflux RND transporter periplasmic adaptor subunit [Stellaceae bacterium]